MAVARELLLRGANSTRTQLLLGSSKAVHVIEDVVTAAQAHTLVQELEPVLQRRRYERNHWDQVIIGYKEVERPFWDDATNQATIDSVRRHIEELVCSGETAARGLPASSQAKSETIEWLPTHVIDLAADGHITPHVDSIKFSGELVCGLSLLSPAIMTLTFDAEAAAADTPPPGTVEGVGAAEGGEGNDEDAQVKLLLPPRSLYVLSGNARYHFAHSIEKSVEEDDNSGVRAARNVFGPSFQRERRISLIFRDTKV